MDEGAVTISKDGVILFCNRRFAQLIDNPIHKVSETNLSDFIAECDVCLYQQVLQEGFSGRIKEEVATINRHGERVYLHLSLCILPDGMIGQICIIVTDITLSEKIKRRNANYFYYRRLRFQH